MQNERKTNYTKQKTMASWKKRTKIQIQRNDNQQTLIHDHPKSQQASKKRTKPS